MKQNLVILSNDANYAEALCQGLNRDRDFPFYVTVVKSEKELEKRVSEEEIDILLLDKQTETKKINHFKIGQLFYLTDVQGYYSVDAIPAIYKYQTLSKIKEGIQKEQKIYINAETEQGINVSRCMFLGLASPIGRIQKTSFSLVYGALLSQGAKVLYVNLEPFSGLEKLFEKSFPGTLSDVIYAHEIEDDKFDVSTVYENFHGLLMIPPVHLAEDIFQCKPEVLKDILLDIGRDELFDVVLVDFGSQFHFLPAFLPVLNRLYIPKTGKEQDNFKLEDFKQFLQRLLQGEEKELVDITIPSCASMVTGKAYLEQLMWNEMGDCARRIIGGIS